MLLSEPQQVRFRLTLARFNSSENEVLDLMGTTNLSFLAHLACSSRDLLLISWNHSAQFCIATVYDFIAAMFLYDLEMH